MLAENYDVIVIGAGFSGAVMAERFASQLNKKVLVLEQRGHVAGNCFDKLDTNGVRIHQYGPHLFHTRHQCVWDYLSQFTRWHPYEHKVLADIDGKLAPVPFNLNSLYAFFSQQEAMSLEKKLVEKYGLDTKVPILELKKTGDAQLQMLATFIYDKLFVNYTSKQWGCKPEDISAEVTNRVPVVLSYDDRYFQDEYQAMPEKGYTALIEKILSHSNITTQLNTNAKNIIKLDNSKKEVLVNDKTYKGLVVYTGMLDALFDYCDGELPYRSIQFKFEQYSVNYYQSATTVNYPNDFNYTRITEFKYLQPNCEINMIGTTIVKEFPLDYCRHSIISEIPYYPILNKKNKDKHIEYKELIDKFNNILIIGRLAEYKYLNMDDCVLHALNFYEKFTGIKNNKK